MRPTPSVKGGKLEVSSVRILELSTACKNQVGELCFYVIISINYWHASIIWFYRELTISVVLHSNLVNEKSGVGLISRDPVPTRIPQHEELWKCRLH